MNNPVIPLYKMADKMIVSAKGCFQYDAEGKAYLDFESGDWAANLGHSHEKVNRAIKAQSELAIHDGLRFRNSPSEELSLKLLEKLSLHGGQSVVLNSGSEAVNLGITIARNLTGRNKILKLDCSFLASYGFGKISPDNSYLINIPMDDFSAIDRIDYNELAVFVFEPGSAWGMVRFPSEEFILKLAEKVKNHGGMLMANEVTTGFGRTGKWFAHHYYPFKPDIVAVGKGMGNGYPVSAVSISEETAEKFQKAPFRYAQSHQNDPLGCAVALAVIDVFEQEKVVEQCKEKGFYFKDRLIDLQMKHKESIREVRGKGLMLVIETVSAGQAENIYDQLIGAGFLVGQKENVLRFMPPLIIEMEHIDRLVNTLHGLL